MSFSLEFVAPTKARAKELVRQASLPDVVRAFLNMAIDSLPLSTEEHGQVISVRAMGHLALTSEWYPHSTATLEVKPISLS